MLLALLPAYDSSAPPPPSGLFTPSLERTCVAPRAVRMRVPVFEICVVASGRAMQRVPHEARVVVTHDGRLEIHD
jgi:hypothetical protein